MTRDLTPYVRFILEEACRSLYLHRADDNHQEDRTPMSRTPEQIAAEAFKLRPRTAQISVWLDDSGSLHAVAPDHANGGLVQIEDPRLTDPEAVESFKKIWAA